MEICCWAQQNACPWPLHQCTTLPLAIGALSCTLTAETMEVQPIIATADETEATAPFNVATVDVVTGEPAMAVLDAATVNAVSTAPPVANSVLDGSPPVATAVVAVVEEAGGIDRPKRTGGGRPKGSKDKVKRKPGGGRPKGAKDKKPRVRRSDKEAATSSSPVALAPASVAAVAEDGPSGTIVAAESAVAIETEEAVPTAEALTGAIADPVAAEAVAAEETMVVEVTDD